MIKIQHLIVACSLIISVSLFATALAFLAEEEKEPKPSRAGIYVLDDNGICWAADKGDIQSRRTVIKTGYGNLWFQNPPLTLILDKDTSDNRISKILQMNVKHCVRIDK